MDSPELAKLISDSYASDAKRRLAAVRKLARSKSPAVTKHLLRFLQETKKTNEKRLAFEHVCATRSPEANTALVDMFVGRHVPPTEGPGSGDTKLIACLLRANYFERFLNRSSINMDNPWADPMFARLEGAFKRNREALRKVPTMSHDEFSKLLEGDPYRLR